MSQGAWIAGGDYRRVNGAATRFAETAVGKHPAPEGALRPEKWAPFIEEFQSVSTRHQKVH